MKGVKSVKLAVVAAVDSDSGSVPTGQTAKLADLFFHDLGASSCTATPIFQGVPCIGATVGGEVFGNVITVRAFRK
jgi:hypothetical protein